MQEKIWQSIFSKITKDQLNFKKRPPSKKGSVLKKIDIELYYNYKDILSSLDSYDFRYLWEEFSSEMHNKELAYNDSYFSDFLTFIYFSSIDNNLGELYSIEQEKFKLISNNIEIYFRRQSENE